MAEKFEKTGEEETGTIIPRIDIRQRTHSLEWFNGLTRGWGFGDG